MTEREMLNRRDELSAELTKLEAETKDHVGPISARWPWGAPCTCDRCATRREVYGQWAVLSDKLDDMQWGVRL